MTCDVTNVAADFTNVATYTAANPLGGPDLTGSDDAEVDVVEPGVAISKTPDLQQVLVGDAATFTITITNDGDQDLVDVTITDPATPDCDAFFASILVGDSETYTCTTGALSADFTNIASVAGTDVLGNPVSDSDDGAVDVIAPAVTISKTPDLQQVPVGGDALFTITVTNTGDVDLTGVTVTDAVAPSCATSIGDLAAGASSTHTCTLTVTADLTNTATVTAVDPLANTISASDTADVEVLVPSIEIQKTPDLQLVPVGDPATFTISVTNTGETDLTDVTVTDVLAPDCDTVIASLIVGATQTHTCSVTPSADFVNTADVTATDPVGGTVTDSDTADVDVIAPALAIAKTPDLQSVPLGGDATFTIEVTNTGDVDLTDVTIADPAAPACDTTIASLATGASTSYTCSLVGITADFTNTASVAATDPLGNPVDGGSDTADVTVLYPAVSIDKSPDSQAVGVGGDAVFTITVTNSGQVDLPLVTVTDPAAPDCDASVGPLVVGASTAYSCTVADVLTDFTNTATVDATDANGNSVTDTDVADVLVLPAGISITKTADNPQVVSGGDVVFTILVENPGPADIVNVVVTDPSYPGCDATFAGIAAGGLETYTCTVTGVTADFTNTIDVAGEDEAGAPVGASDSATVTVLDPAVAIFKTPAVQTITEGDDAVFTITVINTGETDLTAVTVTDVSAPSCDRVFPTLAVGESQTYSCTVTGVLSNFTNTVDVSAVDPIGGRWTDSDSADVVVLATGLVDGLVFEDVDGDGLYTLGTDQPIPSVDVLLTLADGTTTVVVTQADGTWSAVVPVGDTTADVQESDPDFPAGLTESTGTDGQTVTVLDTGTTNTAPVGYAPTASVVGTVFEDTNGDGLQPGDAGVSGVVVRLWEDTDADGIADVLVGAILTDMSGGYSFLGLTPGDYLVEVLLPAGTELTAVDQGGDDAIDSDIFPGTGFSAPVAVTFAEIGDVDAGLIVPAIVGDTVFFDLDGDGLQGTGEPGVAGVTVTAEYAGPDGLFGTADDVTYTTVSGSGGSYSFEVPPGEYTIEIDEPAGSVVTTGNDGAPVSLASGDVIDTVDFGFDATASLSGSIVLDTDADGFLGAADVPLAGIGVTATWAGPDGLFGTADDFDFTAVTDPAGLYDFPDIPPGEYRVSVDSATLPAGVVHSFDEDAVADGTTDVTVAANDSVLGVDFGVAGTLELGATVWYDVDGDAVSDAGEPGIPGVTVTATWAGPDGVGGTADDVPFVATTAPDGSVLFSNLPAGEYTVVVSESTLPDGMTATFDPDGLLDHATTVTLAADVDGLEFGYTGTGAIGDLVWLDLNQDGIRDAGEPGIAGVTVTVTWAGPDGLLGTSDDVTTSLVTAADGTYLAEGLPAGSYLVAIDPDTIPDGVGGALPITTDLAAAETDLTIDFGLGGNLPPVAVDDEATTIEDTPVTISVMDNDTDPEGHAIVVTSVTQPTNGTVTINSDGTITYVPDPEFSGVDVFTYVVCEDITVSGGSVEPEGLCDTATVTVTVTSFNDPPVMVSDSVLTVTVGEAIPPLIFVDVDSENLSFSIVGGTLPPGVILESDGTFTGLPDTPGTYTFLVQVCDDGSPAACTTEIVTLVILGQTATTGGGDGTPSLPYTGANTQAEATWALLLMLFGWALVWGTRRHDESTDGND